MTINYKEILKIANEAETKGDNEGSLKHCTEDTRWEFVGDKILAGKDAVRAWMKETYVDPPKFMVKQLIAEDDFVIAMGTIALKDEKGNIVQHSYCDVWRFRDGKMAELTAFVIAGQSAPPQD